MDTTLWVDTTDRLRLSRAERRGCQSPKDLCRQRGILLPKNRTGVLFVDDLLGYVIYRKPLASAAGAPEHEQELARKLNTAKAVADFNIATPAESAEEWPPSMLRWYLAESHGGTWPTGTGKGQCVAVLDAGIHAGISTLPRCDDHADFCSCNALAADTHARDVHGTWCAGTIAARAGSDGVRRTVAPDCRLVAALVDVEYKIKLRPKDPTRRTTLVNVLLMLSWAVHRWSARVISMSFRATLDDADVGRDILGEIATRLRRLDEALILCSVEEHANGLSYPASAAGIVAVGTYCPRVGISPLTIETQQIRWNPGAWMGKRDLLFAPGEKLSTVTPPDNAYDNFSGSSGACAFAAGVTALYMESYPHLSVDEVLDLMKRDAVKIPEYGFSDPLWPALRFPQAEPASALRRVLWSTWRRLRRMWRRLVRLVGAMAPADVESIPLPGGDPVVDVGAAHVAPIHSRNRMRG